MVLIGNALVTNDAEHLFMCSLASLLFSFMKYLFELFAHFLKNSLFVFYIELYKLFVYFRN